MWENVLDHENGYRQECPQKTYLVCKIDGVRMPLMKANVDEDLAETAFEYYLGKYHGTIKVTVYTTNSPRAQCAKKWKGFLESNKNIQLVLYVTHLYDIKRNSCNLRKNDIKEHHTDGIDNDEHEANYLGLRDLMSLGGNRCRIEAFTKEVWEALLAVMDMSEEFRRRTMRNYDTRLENHDRSRQSEDRRIKKDLNHIKLHSDPWHTIRK